VAFAGSGTDQSAVLILGLVNYSLSNSDSVIISYISKLADGIALMQQGDATHFLTMLFKLGKYLAFIWQSSGIRINGCRF
jgi:hypothetical protein